VFNWSHLSNVLITCPSNVLSATIVGPAL